MQAACAACVPQGTDMRSSHSPGSSRRDPRAVAPTPVGFIDDVGTSYQWNLHALTDVDWNGDRDPWYPPGIWQDYGDLLIDDVLKAHAGLFTFYIEGPMDWGLSDAYKGMSIEIGNHGQFGYHSAGYLDGHAEYRFFDTRRWCGPGWAAINPSWIRTFGTIPRPAHYYQWSGPNPKNCDP